MTTFLDRLPPGDWTLTLVWGAILACRQVSDSVTVCFVFDETKREWVSL